MTNLETIATEIVKTLKDHNHQAVFAGGAVRDKLLGLEPKDIDIATNATPDQIEAIFPKTIPVGKQFGVIIVVHKGVEFEICTFRTDSSDSDGRRPDSVEFSSMEEDAKRRDLTINGIFYDPVENMTYDYVRGIEDISLERIKFIRKAVDRIREDNLRMLRAIRFASKLNFNLDRQAFSVIKDNAALILNVSPERIKTELDKMLLIKKPSKAFELLRITGLLEYILPEVSLLTTCDQSPKWHQEGSVWIHSMMVVDEVRKQTEDLNILWGALLHDIGKPVCFKIEDGVIKAHGHDEAGAGMADSIMRRLKASNEHREAIVNLVKDHMRIKEAPKMKRSKLRKLVAQENLDDLLTLSIADSKSARCTIPELEETKFDFVDTIRAFKEELGDEVELPKPLVTGKDLIELGLKPGPRFKEILDLISEFQLNDKLETREDALLLLKRTLVINE